MDRRTVLKGGLVLPPRPILQLHQATPSSQPEPETSWEDIATADLEPWQSDFLELPPDSERWMGLVTLRLASVMLTR